MDPERQAVFLQGGRVRTAEWVGGCSPAGSAAVRRVFVWQEIQYSHLILCTGTSGTFPGKVNAVSSLEASVQKYEELVEQVSPPVLVC